MDRNKNIVHLSLTNWPRSPPKQLKILISPLSSRIISECGMTCSEIIPVSFSQFAGSNPQNVDHETMLHKFHQHEARRKKKVELLHKIRLQRGCALTQELGWLNCVNSNCLKSTKQTKGTEAGQSREKQKSRMIKSVKSKPKLATFTQPEKHKNSSCNVKQKSKKSKAASHSKSQSSQMERCQKTMIRSCFPHVESQNLISYTPADEYYTCHSSHKNLCKTQKKPMSKSTSQKILRLQLRVLEEVEECLQEWNSLDLRHERQRTALGKLSQKEMRRLQKIHSIEKQKIHNRMVSLKNTIEDKKARVRVKSRSQQLLPVRQ